MIAELADAHEQNRIAVTRDISTTGVAFGTPAPLPIGAKVQVRTLLDGALTDRSDLRGEVVRIEDRVKGENPLWRFLVALRFDRSIPEERLRSTLRAAR